MRDVVAQGADVAHVVVEPFELQQDRAAPGGVLGHRGGPGVLYGLAEREGEQPHVLDAGVDQHPACSRAGPAAITSSGEGGSLTE